MLQRLIFNNKEISEKGSLAVEIVVVAAIIAGSLAIIVGLAAFFLANSHMVQQTSRATALAQEALEIVRNYRDGTGWAAGLDALTPGGPYHPEQTGSPPVWTFVAGAETVEEFTRQVELEEVCRDANDDIIPCGAGVDPDTVRAITTVSWTERGNNHQVELVAYFTNWNQ